MLNKPQPKQPLPAAPAARRDFSNAAGAGAGIAAGAAAFAAFAAAGSTVFPSFAEVEPLVPEDSADADILPEAEVIPEAEAYPETETCPEAEALPEPEIPVADTPAAQHPVAVAPPVAADVVPVAETEPVEVDVNTPVGMDEIIIAPEELDIVEVAGPSDEYGMSPLPEELYNPDMDYVDVSDEPYMDDLASGDDILW